ncbi:MAG: MBOAT family O-acyltransferase [Planctomycetota bacterium]
MLFGELRFLLFFLGVLAVHWALPRNSWRKYWLLFTSYVFYGAWDWRFLALIGGSTLVDYFCGLALGRADGRGLRRLILLLSLVVNLGALAVFKYYDFFAESLNALLQRFGVDAGMHTLGLVLPVGISFYTFQTLSYTISVFRRESEVCRDLRDFALYVAFFPQLVAGPIVRSSDFLPQLESTRGVLDPKYRPLLFLFLAGFVKKYCIADNLAPFVDPVFADPAQHGAATLWTSAAAYYTQIYCDFSGYSDMAIATAGMLGYRLPLNFAFPMLATSVTSAWRRWHISLSSWFRDYLYIPLGGNRRGALRTSVNLWIVFLLCGLWHGANWTFIVWGAIHGLFLVIERTTPARRWFEASPLGLIPTQLVFMLAFVVFRASDLPTAGAFLGGLFGSGPEGSLEDLRTCLTILGVFLVGHVIAYRRIGYAFVERIDPRLQDVLLGAAAALALPFAANAYEAFIYFQF